MRAWCLGVVMQGWAGICNLDAVEAAHKDTQTHAQIQRVTRGRSVVEIIISLILLLVKCC